MNRTAWIACSLLVAGAALAAAPATPRLPDGKPDLNGTWDNGGVHVNSGIANLAFKLLVTGGRHPRNKSTVTVPALGMEKARAIFYRTLTTYLTSTSEYAELRSAAVFAANELYGASARDAVATAFTAVGVDPALAAALPVTLVNSGTEKVLSDKKYGQIFDYFACQFEYKDGTTMISVTIATSRREKSIVNAGSR